MLSLNGQNPQENGHCLPQEKLLLPPTELKGCYVHPCLSVCLPACLSACRITKKVMDGFGRNLHG